MAFLNKTEEYYKTFIELQNRLRKSEEERLVLELKFNEMVQTAKEEEQEHYKKMNSQYKHFLREDKKRQERNEKIIRTLERIETRVNMLSAKTDRVNLLRKQYQGYLERINQMKLEKKLPTRPEHGIKTYVPGRPPEKYTSTNYPDEKSLDLKDDDFYKVSKPIQQQNYPYNLEPAIYGRVTFEDKFSYDDYNTKFAPKVSDNHSRKNNYEQVEKPPIRDFVNESASDHFRRDWARSDADISAKYNRKDLIEPQLHDNEKLYQITTEGNLPFQRDQNIGRVVQDDCASLRKSIDNIKADAQQLIDNNAFSNDQITGKTNRIFCEPKLDKNNENELISQVKPRSLIDQHYVGSPKQELSNFTSEIDLDKRVNLPERYTDVKVPHQEIHLENIGYSPSNSQLESNVKLPQSESHFKDTEIKKNEEKVNSLSDGNMEMKIQSENNDQYNKEQQDVGKQLEENELFLQNLKEARESPEELTKIDNDQFVNEISGKIQPEINQNDNQPSVVQQVPYEESSEVQLLSENEASVKNLNDSVQPDFQYKEQEEINYEQNVLQQNENVGPTNYDQNEENGQPMQYNETDQLIQNTENSQPVHYDENGQPPMQYDENGHQPLQYDENGQPTQYDENGQPIQYDENGIPIQYDQNGQPIQYDINGQPIQYDENGQPIQYDQNAQSIQYDVNGQPIQYDENGQPIQYDENGQPIQYDVNGQPIQYDEHGQQIQYDQNIQPIQYDENGQPIQYDENVQPIHYDELGQPIQYDEHGQQIHYDQNVQPIQYDENGQPIQFDENGQPIQYDENGQLLQYSENTPLTEYNQPFDQNGQPVPYDGNGQPLHVNELGQPIPQDQIGEPTQIDENREPIQFEKNYPDNQDSKLISSDPPVQSAEPVVLPEDNGAPIQRGQENEDSSSEPPASELKVDSEESDKDKIVADQPRHVMDMLDTDTESVKQDTKISNDSDFDFSNG